MLTALSHFGAPALSRARVVLVAPVTVRQLAAAAAAAAAPAAGAAPAALPAKESPFKPGYMLRQENAGQVYSNLEHLCANNRAVRAHEFHKLLDLVQTEKELNLALEGLELCKSRKVHFNEQTPVKLVHAACRASKPSVALDVLRHSAKHGLQVVPASAYSYLLVHGGLTKNMDVVSATQGLLKSSGSKQNQHVLHALVKAHVDAGRVDKALEDFQKTHASKIKVSRATLHKLLNAVVEDGGKLNAKAGVINALIRVAEATPGIKQELLLSAKTVALQLSEDSKKA